MLVAWPADAQDNYVPPPMFGAPSPVAKTPKPEPAPPKKAVKIEQRKVQPAPKIVEPAPIKKAPPAVKPKPAEKKMVVVPPAPKPIPQKEVVKKAEPTIKPVTVTNIEAPKPTPTPKAMPAKTSSAGVVKGPKVMPAVKKQGVDAEVLYAPSNNKQVGLIDRAQPKAEENKVENEQIASIDFDNLPKFTPTQDGEQVISLMFEPASTTLDNKLKASLKQVVDQFIKNDGQKIQLVSYASAVSGELSSDRRIALSRALAIRGYLTERGIESRYIEVRALGLVESDQPKDRAELTIIK